MKKKNPEIELAVTPTEGYKRQHFRGIHRQNKNDKDKGTGEAESGIAMEWEEVNDGRDRPAHQVLLQGREEGIPGRGELQADDCLPDNEDRVEDPGAGGVAGDVKV